MVRYGTGTALVFHNENLTERNIRTVRTHVPYHNANRHQRSLARRHVRTEMDKEKILRM